MKEHLDIACCRVKHGSRVNLRKDFDPDWRPKGPLRELSSDDLKKHAREFLKGELEELTEAQERLFANGSWSVLIVLQAIDAAGKDSMIKHVMSGVNPSGCVVSSFNKPSMEELKHDFLWRCSRRLPERGTIGIFNRSYYEEVLVVRVHPEYLAKQNLPDGAPDKKFWKNRFDSINDFERHLVRNGTLVLKFFLNVSREEQKKRFLARLNESDKNWKFDVGDLDERKHWDEYQEAFESMLENTSTEWAPWYVVPSDHKFLSRAIVAEVITEEIAKLDIGYPKLSKEEKKALAEAKRRLESEKD